MSQYFRQGKPLRNTELRNGGRIAGEGILYDDYGDESYGGYNDKPCFRVHFPNDDIDPKELNGPIITLPKT